MKSSSRSRKMSVRNPSHLGSKIHPSPGGSSATRLASIGRTGGLTGRCMTEERSGMDWDSAPAGCEHDNWRPTIWRSDLSRQSVGVLNARLPMRAVMIALMAVAGFDSAKAQPPGKWPPDSLVNVQVIPKTTQPVQVWGMMRNIAGALGVSCTFCHVGSDSAPLERIDFATDEKRNKRVARQMMRMVQEVNNRLDTIPSRPTPTVTVTCITCHRGVNRPVPLPSIIVEAATAAGADSAIRTYRALRDRYFGRDAYDFGEVSLNTAAFRTA